MTNRTATAELERAVHLALSRFVGSQGGRRTYAWFLCVAVAAIGQLEETTGGGGWPDGRIALRETGLSVRQLDEKWVIAQANGNLLDEAILRTFVPLKLWPSLEQVIEDGPVVAWAKLEQVLRCWSRGVEIDGSPRVGGAWSAGTVAICVNAFHRFMRELTEVRKLALTSDLGISPELLKRQWGPENIPRRLSAADLGAAPGNSDRSAPSLRSARLALRAAHRRVESRQEVAGQRSSQLRPLRERALLALFLVLGSRRGAISELRRRDFVRHHRSGGHEGPAIMLRPGKTVHSDLTRVKFLPPEVGDWIQEWIDYVGIADQPDAPLWLARPGASHRIIDQAVEFAIVRAMAPFVDGRRCSPHTLRHLCEKLAFVGGMDWLEQHRHQLLDGDLSGLPASPQTFADVLLDHALSSVQDRYRDIASEQGRETWARIAAHGVWDLVWGDKGARKGLDPVRIREAQERLRGATDKLREAERRVVDLRAKKQAVRAEIVDSEAVLDIKQILILSTKADAIADELGDAADVLLAATTDLEHARRELDEAKAARIAIPDEEDPVLEVDELPPLDNELETTPAADLPPLRDCITPKEFQWALGGPRVISDATLRRYTRGQMPFRSGDRRNVWDPSADPSKPPSCINRLSERRTLIVLDELDLSRFPQLVVDRLEYLKTVPEGEVFVELAAA